MQIINIVLHSYMHTCNCVALRSENLSQCTSKIQSQCVLTMLASVKSKHYGDCVSYPTQLCGCYKDYKGGSSVSQLQDHRLPVNRVTKNCCLAFCLGWLRGSVIGQKRHANGHRKSSPGIFSMRQSKTILPPPLQWPEELELSGKIQPKRMSASLKRRHSAGNQMQQ